MTKEEKIKWLATISAEELINQLRGFIKDEYDNPFKNPENFEDYKLIKTEMIKRMNGGN